MIFTSPTSEYMTLSAANDRFYVRSEKGVPGTLILIRDNETAKLLTPQLLDFSENEAFSDFIEFFPFENGLCAIFAYNADAMPIESVLDNAPTELRAAIIKSFFALIFSQNMPMLILRQILKKGNLYATTDGAIFPVYNLWANDYDETDLSQLFIDAVRGMAGGIELAALSELYSKLDSDEYDYADLYVAADKVASELLQYMEPEKTASSFELVSIKVHRVGSYFSSCWVFLLAATVLLAGYVAAGFLFYHTVIAPPVVDNGINAIGTVVIDNVP